MTDRKLYIDEQLIDLYDDEPIGLTLRANELGAVGELQAGFSNRFNIPKTAGNRRILSDPEQVNNSTALPYTERDARYFQDGVPILQRGRAILEEAEKDYVLNIYGQNFSLIEWLGDKKLSDIDFSAIDHNWNLTNVRLGMNNEPADGYVYALANYGSLEASGVQVDVRALPPCLYARWLFDQIFAAAPFAISGDLLSDPFFNSLVADIDELTVNYFIDQYTGNGRLVTFTSDQNYTYFDIGTNPNSGTILNFDSAYKQPGGANSPSFFEVLFAADFQIDYEIDYEYTSTTPGRRAFLDFGPGQVDGTSRVREEIVINQREQVSGQLTLDYTAGDRIYLRVTPNTATVGSDTLTIYSGRYTIRPVNTAMRGRVSFAESVHDMTQADFVKNIFALFGVVPGYEDVAQVLTVDYLQNKIADSARASAKDWTEKIDFSQPVKIETRLPGFGQSNTLAYDDEATGLYNSDIQIADQTIDPVAELVSLDFAASEMRLRLEYNINMPRVLKYEPEGSPVGYRQTANFAPRLFYVVDNTEELALSDGNSTQTTTDYKVAKFYDAGQPVNLSFTGRGNMLDRQFAKLRDGVCVLPKIVNAYFKLSEPDVHALQLPQMVYLNCISEGYTINGYFYVNKIEDYVGGIPAQVELIRVL